MKRENPKIMSGISAESGCSGRNSIHSLDRISQAPSKQSSVNLIEVMSCEHSDRGKDFCQKLMTIEQETYRIVFQNYQKRSRKSAEENKKFEMQEQSPLPASYNYSQKPGNGKINSAIMMQGQEEEDVCMRRRSLKVHNVPKENIYCTSLCVKSKCLKKYCQCFRAGLKCGRQCKCKACQNAGRIEQQGEIKIGEPYLQYQTNSKQMHQMQLDPPDFNNNQ